MTYDAPMRVKAQNNDWVLCFILYGMIGML